MARDLVAGHHVIVVDDDERLLALARLALQKQGIRISTAETAEGAQRLMGADPPDLVILDIVLPDMSGWELLRQIRETDDCLVMLLSGRDSDIDKARGLDLGADDYLTKPFWPEELLARVKARLRRPALAANDGELAIGPLRVNANDRIITVGSQVIELTRVEFDLLHALARRPGAAVSRSWLVDHVLDAERDGAERTLDVHVSRLRKKLGATGSMITTVWGVGYRLQDKA